MGRLYERQNLTDNVVAAGNPARMSSPKLRIGRASMAGYYYALTMVVANRQPFFARQEVAGRLAHELSSDAPGLRFVPLAWTIMPDHVHLLVELADTPLSRCMQILKSRTSRQLRGVVQHGGTLWQAGFYDHCLRSDEDLRNQARYILNNPVRAGLVPRPQDHAYSWSIWGKEP